MRKVVFNLKNMDYQAQFSSKYAFPTCRQSNSGGGLLKFIEPKFNCWQTDGELQDMPSIWNISR